MGFQKDGAEMGKEESNSNAEAQNEQSLKEQRVRSIAISYYSRPDIRKAIFEFSKNRECVPRYFEGFGKRPDAFQYDSDILELAKKGATSFHCSEEIWRDPLELNTGMNEKDVKELRIGWDLLIDVDSKYLDYSKIYAEILIEVLLANGIKHIGVKFSGSKGWHIIVPWKAFPLEISGKKTCEMFPEWPRMICRYLNSKIAERLKNRILDISEKNSDDKLERYCVKCNNNSEEKIIVYFTCPFCRTKMQNPLNLLENKRKISCTMCGKEIMSKKELNEEVKKESSDRIGKEIIYFCSKCNLDSRTNSDNFKQRVQSKHIDADLVLVSPRHLFRMPYSLHEKTSLASVVIDYNKIKDFDPKQADPMKIIPRNFMPDSEPNEAMTLLRNSLEFKQSIETENKDNIGNFKDSEYEKQNKDKQKTFSDIKSLEIKEEHYPPTIKKILEGIKTDGRKRALFILISFFMSLKLPLEEIKQKIIEWDAKNHLPLKDGYIKAQLSWYSKQKETKLPPNFDKSYYRDIGITPTPEELNFKNPVNYAVKKYFSMKGNYSSNSFQKSNIKYNKK